jgi:hypothetical protein
MTNTQPTHKSDRTQRTRDRIFVTQWLPAATNVSADTYDGVSAQHLKELYKYVYYLGPRGTLVEVQMKRMKVVLDELRQQPEKKLFKFVNRFLMKIDNFEYDNRINLAKSQRGLFQFAGTSQKVTEDKPMVWPLYHVLREELRHEDLAMIEHGLNDQLLTFVMVSLNIKKIRQDPMLETVAKTYDKFCLKYDIPTE